MILSRLKCSQFHQAAKEAVDRRGLEDTIAEVCSIQEAVVVELIRNYITATLVRMGRVRHSQLLSKTPQVSTV